MKNDEYEVNVNSRLCDLLIKAGLPANKEVKLVASKRADILVEFENHNIAVECELAGSSKQKMAIDDALSRVAPHPYASAAFAVVYPPSCTSKSLDLNTKINVAFVDETHAETLYQQGRIDDTVYEGTRKPQYSDLRQTPDWQCCTVQDLAGMIFNARRDMGDPDALVKALNDSLSKAVRYLPLVQVRTLGKSLDLAPEGGTHADRNAERQCFEPAARRALLVVATAALFHSRLDEHLHDINLPKDVANDSKLHDWPPLSLGSCYSSPDTIAELSKSWHMILKVDYRPIFEAALSVINSLSTPQFTSAVKDMIQWARGASGQMGLLRHDVLGRIFHRLLEGRYDGSFYTSVPAAIILAGIAIRGREDIPKNLADMKVIDAACGTGTLLMAAAERIKDVVGDRYDERTIIEDVLTGIDINITALHIAATTLGLLSPTTQFRKMDIRKAPFGAIGKRGGGGVVSDRKLQRDHWNCMAKVGHSQYMTGLI